MNTIMHVKDNLCHSLQLVINKDLMEPLNNDEI